MEKNGPQAAPIFPASAAVAPMADPSEEVPEASQADIPPYTDDEAQEIALHRKLRKDEAKAAKRQRREQAVADKEKAYDSSTVI